MELYYQGLFNGVVFGIVTTIAIVNTYRLYKNEINLKLNKLFKKKKKFQRKNLPTYSNNVIPFPTKKQGY